MSQESSKWNKLAAGSQANDLSVADETAFRRLLRRITVASVALAFFLLVAVLFLLNLIFFSNSQVNRTNAVLSELFRVETLSENMSESLHSFQLVGDPALLEPFENAEQTVPQELETLYTLVQDDKSASSRLVDLRTAHRGWMDFANDALEKAKAHEPSAPQSDQRAKFLMDNVRSRIAAMRGYEEGLLAARAHFLTRVKAASLTSVVVAALLLAPLLILYLRRTLKQLSRNYREALGCLEREREQATNVLESITDGFYALDREWNVTSLNRRAEELLTPFRKRRDRLLGANFWKEFPDFVGTQFEKKLRHVMATGEVVDWEVFYAPLNAWFTIRIFPARDGVALFFEEITERKTAAEKIRETEERLQLAVKAGKLGVWHVDLDEMHLTASPQCKANFGRGPDDPFSYAAMVSAIHPEDRSVLEALAKRTIAEVGSYKVDYRCIWPDGSLHWINGQGRVLADENGKPMRLVGVTTDITEQKLAEYREIHSEEEERVLAEATAKFRVFFEGPFLACLMTPEGTVTEVSKRTLNAYGFRQEDVVGTKFWDCGWWDPLPNLQKAIRIGVFRASTGKTFHEETECFAADGSRRLVDLKITPIMDNSGQVLLLASTGTEKMMELTHH